MVRKSRREIEHAVEHLETNGRLAVSEYMPLEEYYPEDIVEFIFNVSHALIRIRFRHPDKIVNRADPEGTLAYLELVRHRFDIEGEHDDAVRQGLEDNAEGEEYGPIDAFTMGPITVAKHTDLTSSNGKSLESLVDAGRDHKAEQLLVQTVYDVFNTRHSQPVKP